MTKPLTLFEHRSQPFDWTERDWTLVDRINSAFGAEVLRLGLKRGEKQIRAAQHVGVIRLHGRTIQILPKIYLAADNANEDIRRKEATANLLRMLEYAGELRVREYELASMLRQTDDWFELLTRLFATHLRDEWQRGTYRTYETIEEELPILKGKWRIADHLRRPDLRAMFSVAYDEFTANNKLNRIFRYVVERLWQLTRDINNRQILSELRNWMDEVTLVSRFTVEDANSAQLTRLTERYRPLLNLARVFLDNGALHVTSGDLTTFAFLFDMNLLFEKFIASFMRRHACDILPDVFLSYDFLPQSCGAKMYLAQRGDKSVFQTIPDIAFRSGELFPLLIDTKYKLLDDKERDLGVSQSDFYQMHAYAHRYKCNRVVLLYPYIGEGNQPVCFKLEGCEKVIQINTVNISKDLGSIEGRRSLVAELKQLFPKETSL